MAQNGQGYSVHSCLVSGEQQTQGAGVACLGGPHQLSVLGHPAFKKVSHPKIILDEFTRTFRPLMRTMIQIKPAMAGTLRRISVGMRSL
jgi:hypothetical protein